MIETAVRAAWPATSQDHTFVHTNLARVVGALARAESACPTAVSMPIDAYGIHATDLVSAGEVSRMFAAEAVTAAHVAGAGRAT
jgi:hypothetical protein